MLLHEQWFHSLRLIQHVLEGPVAPLQRNHGEGKTALRRRLALPPDVTKLDFCGRCCRGKPTLSLTQPRQRGLEAVFLPFLCAAYSASHSSNINYWCNTKCQAGTDSFRAPIPTTPTPAGSLLAGAPIPLSLPVLRGLLSVTMNAVRRLTFVALALILATCNAFYVSPATSFVRSTTATRPQATQTHHVPSTSSSRAFSGAAGAQRVEIVDTACKLLHFWFTRAWSKRCMCEVSS